MIIGITGGTGCGKTTLLDVLQEHGYTVLDMDAIYHELLQTDTQLLADIEARFPGTVENGQLQRKKLGAIVFKDKQEMAALSKITGSAIRKEVMRRLEANPQRVAMDAIGLLEGGYDKLCKLTIAVTAPDDIRLQRIMARDGITEEYARTRIQAQKPQSFYTERCDYTLVNDSTREKFRRECLAFFRRLGIIEENA